MIRRGVACNVSVAARENVANSLQIREVDMKA